MATAKQIKESGRARFMLAGSLHLRGLSYAKIGAVMGVGAARAGQLVMRFNRNCTWTAHWDGLKPHEYMALKPVQDWLNFLTEETK